jgi:hypothetical protein
VLNFRGVKTQNITLKLPAETIRKAKVIAAQRNASISALVVSKVEDLVGEDATYQAARRRALHWLAQGWHLSNAGDPIAIGSRSDRDQIG